MNKWISIFDREPAVDEKVLVMTANHKVTVSSMYGKWGDRRWHGSGSFNDSIIAWCPIPKYDLEDE